MIVAGEGKRKAYREQGWWGDQTLADLFEANARAHPARMALIDAPNRADFAFGTPRRLTYADLATEVRRLAGALVLAGVGKDDVVMIQLPNISEFVALYFAAATIGAMGTRAARAPELLGAAVAGAVLSTVATFVQLVLLIGATDLATLRSLSRPLACGGGAALLYGGVFMALAFRQKMARQDEPGHAFSVKSAILFAGLLAAILVASAALEDWFGESGLLAVASLAGLADTHSAAISVASLVASGKLGADAAVVPILAAVTTNSATKMIFAFTTGGTAFAVRVVPGLLLVLAAAWAGARFLG